MNKTFYPEFRNRIAVAEYFKYNTSLAGSKDYFYVFDLIVKDYSYDFYFNKHGS